ncbi:hypothetical protein P12x_004145 [Tundrisphaera lichenicola]|uniref:hypothetical protein n=1 Tax=Tundrisphaera lichenicola TaxID=2029860 RepID=UPI003EBBA5F9
MQPSKLCGAWKFLLIASLALMSGCGDEEIQLQKAKPVDIGERKDEKASKSQATLKKGAPPIGSSSGMTHNPSETPRP